MCHGLILLFGSTSYKQTHCIKSARNQAVSIPVNGTVVVIYQTITGGGSAETASSRPGARQWEAILPAAETGTRRTGPELPQSRRRRAAAGKFRPAFAWVMGKKRSRRRALRIAVDGGGRTARATGFFDKGISKPQPMRPLR